MWCVGILLCYAQARHRGSVEGNQGDIIFFMLNTSSLFNIMKKNLIHSEGINPGLHASVQCLCLCMRTSSTPPEEVLLQTSKLPLNHLH